MMDPGIGCVQHRGGILDSSVVACRIMILRHSAQYVWPHGKLCKAFDLLKSLRQHMQELEVGQRIYESKRWGLHTLWIRASRTCASTVSS